MGTKPLKNMKATNLLLAFTAVLLCTATYAQSAQDCTLEKQIKYHENGQIRFAGHADCEGNWHGHFIEYHEDGSIYGIGEFNHGIKAGTWTTYPLYTDVTYVKEFGNTGKLAKASIMENDLVVQERQYTR